MKISKTERTAISEALAGRPEKLNARLRELSRPFDHLFSDEWCVHLLVDDYNSSGLPIIEERHGVDEWPEDDRQQFEVDLFRTGSVEEALAMRGQHPEVQPDDYTDAIDKLPPSQADLLRAHYVDGESITDYARRKGIPLATVKSRRERGLKALRAC